LEGPLQSCLFFLDRKSKISTIAGLAFNGIPYMKINQSIFPVTHKKHDWTKIIPEWPLGNLLHSYILRESEIQTSYSTKSFNKGPYEQK
jgi:hypothetical protein